MIKILKNLILLCLTLALISYNSYAFSKKNNIDTFKKNQRQLLVKYKQKAPQQQKDKALFSAGAYSIKKFDLPKNLELVHVTKGISLDAAKKFLEEDPNVEYVNYDYIQHINVTLPPFGPPPENDNPGNPNNPTKDPKLKEQWGLNNLGQTGGKIDADVNAPEMWEIFPDEADVVIAVLDTGINLEHQDLKANLWVNENEIPGNNIDDDNNGVIDDIHGFNAKDNTGVPMDDHGHGSHCAGIIAAESNNPFGGRGLLPKAKIISCKFIGSDGNGNTSDAIACLNYLLELKTRAENPVNIIATSNSWGGGPSEQALKDAIQAHQDAGILFVAAASNDGLDNDTTESYPANYLVSNVISVAASNHNDDLAWFSNYGQRTVHVAAPGEQILSTTMGNKYEKYDGTSMATPFVAALAGAISAFFPEHNYIKIKNLIMAGGTPLPALQGKTISGRRIRAIDNNGQGSLSCKDQVIKGRLSPSQNKLSIPVGEKVILSAVNINCAEPNGTVLIPLYPSGESIKLKDTGHGIDSAADDGMYTTEWIATEAGRFEFEFPDNDIVVITVYDPQEWSEYADIPEEFNYININGSKLEATDEWTGKIELPFSIPFAGFEAGFDRLFVSSNGGLSLTNMNELGYENLPLPNENLVSLIAPFWDDLNPENDNSDGIYYEIIGEEPNRQVVVEWRDVYHFSSQKGITFQVVLFENSSDILFNYLDVDFADEAYNSGASATIGVQSTKDKFKQLGFDSNVLQSQTSFRFSLNLDI